MSDREFNQGQSSENGHGCWKCGYPKMAVIRSNRTVKDNFQPGWQPNLAKHIGTYSEYKAELKKRGLIEFGYEDIEERHQDHYEQNYFDDAMLKKIYDNGLKLSGREIEAIKSGKLDEM